jgi:hypothetical protein
MWHYKNLEFNPTEDELSEYVGFVYLITELDTGKKYVGKKFFWSTRKIPPLKGQKRKRTVKKQSDWMQYYGSSEDLKLLVEKKGADAYYREILRLCKTKGECSYYEAKEQFDRDVLLREDYYNAFIGCKIHAKHLGNKK